MKAYRSGERLLAAYLSTITGFIDALGFMYLGGYFLSFMSGNTTRLTTGLTEGDLEVVGKAGGLMMLFLIGVAIGALISQLGERHLPPTRTREAILLFICLTSVIASIGVVVGNPTLAVLSLSFTVGAMNSTFERDGEVSISLTYMTGTLVKMAQRFVGAFFGESHRGWLMYLTQWAALALGAIIGGFSYVHLGLYSVWVVTGLLIAGTVVALAYRQWRRNRRLPV
ncbi:MAG: YoaK family protein [Corynebacterium sp.]|uniref:YoaK family protein n=1 Tax=Corynebacterium sp. TaxID=1720 RepID=UPI0026DCE6E0|nr:YoaK family protein [Corynebacterium sp.]MDO5029801.1 YoaK family protein [Corynebacterium sp.]